jgi:hypothetical protein
MTEIAFAVAAVTCRVMWISLVAKERRHRRVGTDDHRATRATVATRGTALGLALHSLKRSNPRTAIPGAEADTDPVYKHDRNEISEGGSFAYD